MQVLKLKEQLSEAEKEMQRLQLERCDGISSNSPTTSSLSMEAAMDPPFLGEFGLDNAFYGPENTYYGPANTYAQGLEWVNNLYMPYHM